MGTFEWLGFKTYVITKQMHLELEGGFFGCFFFFCIKRNLVYLWREIKLYPLCLPPLTLKK